MNILSLDVDTLSIAPNLPLSYRQHVSVLLVMWFVYDTISTYAAIIATGTIEHEANMIVRYFLSVHVLSLIPLKLVAGLGVLLLAMKGEQHIKVLPYWRVVYVALTSVVFFVGTMNMFVAIMTVM